MPWKPQINAKPLRTPLQYAKQELHSNALATMTILDHLSSSHFLQTQYCFIVLLLIIHLIYNPDYLCLSYRKVRINLKL